MVAPAKKLGDAFDALFLKGLFSNRTEEEWVKHDQLVAKEQAAMLARDREQAWLQKEQFLLQRGLCPKHLEQILSGTMERVPAIDAITKVDSVGLSVMSGNAGCGKTHAGHVWLLDALTRPPEKWQSASIRRATAAAFARTSRYENNSNKIAVLAKPKKLVLDDLGVEHGDAKGSFLVDLDELLDIRWSNNSATLLLTNLTASDFSERYGRRLYDRCRGQDRWFDVPHPSMRGG